MSSNKSSEIKASRGRPKTLDREQTIDVAMQAYWCGGVTNISLNEICRRAKVSKPGLYREFGNEDGLLKAVLFAYQKQRLAPVYQMIAADVPFRESLDMLIAAVTMVDDDPKAPKGCLSVNMREAYMYMGEATQEQIGHVKEEALTAYEEWVERAKTKGEFSADMSSQFAAIYIDSQISHTLSQIARGEDSNTVKKVLILAFSILG